MEFFQLLFYDSYLLKHRLHTDIFLIVNSFETKFEFKKVYGIHKEIEQELKIGIPRSFFFFFCSATKAIFVH